MFFEIILWTFLLPWKVQWWKTSKKAQLELFFGIRLYYTVLSVTHSHTHLVPLAPIPPPSINSQPLPISPIYSCQFLPTLTNSPTSSASTHCHSLPPTLSSFDTLQFTLLLLNVLLYYSIHSKLLQSKIIYSLYYSCLPIHCIKSLPLRVNYNN